MKGNSEMLSLLFVDVGAAEAESNQGLKFSFVGQFFNKILCHAYRHSFTAVMY